MLVFGSEMHIVTFIICILEFGMLSYQLVYYLYDPRQHGRFWYLVLLALLIVYNVCGGLLPNERYSFSIIGQNMVAYGSGFLIACYFPYYFYRAFKLESIRLYALYGSLLCLFLPYVVFFMMVYPITGRLEMATSYGMIIPFLYSVVVLYKMLNAIRMKIAERSMSPHPYSSMEMVGVYAAVSPWVTMSVFAYLNVPQWLEALVTNLGFLVITILFITKSVKVARLENQKLSLLHRIAPNEEIFEANLLKYDFTAREIEIIRLLRSGCTHQEIADQLFIATGTVARHVQNIHSKAGVRSRLNLIRKLEMP